MIVQVSSSLNLLIYVSNSNYTKREDRYTGKVECTGLVGHAILTHS